MRCATASVSFIKVNFVMLFNEGALYIQYYRCLIMTWYWTVVSELMFISSSISDNSGTSKNFVDRLSIWARNGLRVRVGTGKDNRVEFTVHGIRVSFFGVRVGYGYGLRCTCRTLIRYRKCTRIMAHEEVPQDGIYMVPIFSSSHH